jgi:thiamine phosphate synthase YjbQ (UPF0047 family)
MVQKKGINLLLQRLTSKRTRIYDIYDQIEDVWSETDIRIGLLAEASKFGDSPGLDVREGVEW